MLGESTTDMPTNADDDFALHIDIWELDDEIQQDCFSLFPSGAEMLERAKNVRSIVPRLSAITDKKLLIYLEAINKQIESVVNKSNI